MTVNIIEILKADREVEPMTEESVKVGDLWREANNSKRSVSYLYADDVTRLGQKDEKGLKFAFRWADTALTNEMHINPGEGHHNHWLNNGQMDDDSMVKVASGLSWEEAQEFFKVAVELKHDQHPEMSRSEPSTFIDAIARIRM